MAISVYEIGESVHLTADFTTADGSTPAGVACKVKRPNGSMLNPDVTVLDDGTYQATVATDLAGKWFYRWQCNGAAEEGQFRVISSRVI